MLHVASANEPQFLRWLDVGWWKVGSGPNNSDFRSGIVELRMCMHARLTNQHNCKLLCVFFFAVLPTNFTTYHRTGGSLIHSLVARLGRDNIELVPDQLIARIGHPTMASPLVAGIIGLLSLYAFLLALLKLTHNAREPAAISTSIPFIGPLLEMGKHKARFHPLMRDQHTSLPIYTLRLPFARMYIINSAALVAPVQRLYRTLSFAAIEAQAAAKICNLTKEGNEVVQKGLMKDDSYTGKFGSAIHPALTPGENLDAMNRNAVQTIAASLDRLQASGGKEATLFEWVRDEIVLATSDAVYGPHNPLRDPEALQAW